MPPESSALPPDLARVLREAGPDELLSLLRLHRAELTPAAVAQALRNPFAGPEAVDLVIGEQRWLSSYEVRRELAGLRSCPEAVAMRFLPALAWRDLLELGLDVRVRPPVRAAADRYVTERLVSLSEGEKMSIARRASTGVLARLRHDPSVRVISALLENPRLSEGLLAPLVYHPNTRPQVLALVAANPRWGVRYDLKVGIAKNAATPIETALRILPSLKKEDLRAVLAGERVSPIVRRRARLLLGT